MGIGPISAIWGDSSSELYPLLILSISSVVIKVLCLQKKGKTVTPSSKLQAKGGICEDLVVAYGNRTTGGFF